MTDDELLERITIDPTMIVAQPVIRGTRLPVEHVLNLLAHGASAEGIQRQYPGLTRDDVQACILFAARGLSTTSAPASDSAGPMRQPLPIPQPLAVDRRLQRSPSSGGAKGMGTWAIIGLCVLVIGGLLLVPVVTGLVMYSMIHDIWTWDSPSEASQTIMDGILGTFEGESKSPTNTDKAPSGTPEDQLNGSR